MRKTILGHDDHPASSSSEEWFGLESIAGIGVTSEADDAPVENVLYPDRETGWRAGEPGPQLIQITFNGPRNIRLSLANNRSAQKLLSCSTFISVMKTAEFWNCDNFSHFQLPLRERTLLAEAQVGSRFVVVAEIRRQGPLERASV
jgi:hypothetical protein